MSTWNTNKNCLHTGTDKAVKMQLDSTVGRWNNSKTLNICGAQTICLSDIICVIHTDIKCQLREAVAFAVVISCQTVTVCSVASGFSLPCNLGIRCTWRRKKKNPAVNKHGLCGLLSSWPHAYVQIWVSRAWLGRATLRTYTPPQDTYAAALI